MFIQFFSFAGLTDKQLYQVFDLLGRQPNAKAIYRNWTTKIAETLLAPHSPIRMYKKINLHDPKQRNETIFPLFRYHMYVIDFWLAHFVYPFELKTFENKVTSTTWDLCSKQLAHPVTGFSGTNDTKNMLPITVTQNDHEELVETNEKVRANLLRDENQTYKALPANVSSEQILVALQNENIPVLLDCGALMLKLNNEQVARGWLKLVNEEDFEAAIFFEINDNLMVIDRNEIIAEFDSSIYRDKLDKCVVYLDDAHTRGTDLKFPMDWRAAVTLSGE